MLLTLFKFTTLLIPITAFGLGFFSLYKNPKSKAVFLWFLMSLAIGFWGIFHYFHITSTTEYQAYMNGIVLHIGAIFIPIFFYHFVLEFVFRPKNSFIFLAAGYVLAIFLLILLLNTKLLVAGASPKLGFPFWLDAGQLYYLIFLHFYTYIIAGMYLLYKTYRKSDGVIRRKTFYVLLGMALGFGFGGTNFLPHTLGIYPFGSFVTFLYPIIIFYGIFVDEIKFKLFR